MQICKYHNVIAYMCHILTLCGRTGLPFWVRWIGGRSTVSQAILVLDPHITLWLFYTNSHIWWFSFRQDWDVSTPQHSATGRFSWSTYPIFKALQTWPHRLLNFHLALRTCLGRPPVSSRMYHSFSGPWKVGRPRTEVRRESNVDLAMV